jgi:hypothetical protein
MSLKCPIKKPSREVAKVIIGSKKMGQELGSRRRKITGNPVQVF